MLIKLYRDARRASKYLLNRRGLRWLYKALTAPSRAWWACRAWCAERAWRRDAKRYLDRDGLHWLLGLIMSRTREVRDLGITGIYYRDGMWIHRYAEGYVYVDAVDSPLPTITSLYADTHAIWEQNYTPRRGDTVVDIGAGTGTEVLSWSAAVGPTGRVIAVEAHPATCRHLARFCKLNRLSNVIPLNLAVSAVAGTVSIENTNDYKFASIMSGQGALEVRALTLDQLLDETETSSVDYLKMNIEGAETSALEGLTTSTPIARLCVSCHDFRADWGHGEHFRTKVDVIRLLTAAGYIAEPHKPDPAPWIRDQVYAHRTGSGEGT